MILDTAAYRHLVRHPEAPAAALDGAKPIHVCRLVFDPDEQVFGVEEALSAVGRSIASGMRRGGAVDADGQLRRARELILSGKITLVDMTDQELRMWSAVRREAAEESPLGISGAASATIAIARCRSWPVLSADTDVVRFARASRDHVIDITAS